MKILFTLILIFVGFISFSQINNCDDTTQTCMPNSVAKEILIDLNRLDKANALNQSYKEEITQLNNKIDKLNSVNSLLQESNELSLKITKSTEEKVKLYEEDNKKLRTEISGLKRKTTIIEIVAAGIIGGLTYVITRK